MLDQCRDPVGGLLACSLLAACANADVRDVDPVVAAVRQAGVRNTRSHSVVPHKGHASVLIEGAIDGNAATITVTFVAAAEDAWVEVAGTGGMRILSSPNPFGSASVKAGQSVQVRVDIDPLMQHGDLSVTAGGRYAGRPQAVVRSFRVGEGTGPARQVDTPQTVRISGTLMQLMPAEHD